MLRHASGQLLNPKHTSAAPTIPDWFMTALRHIDPALFVLWNPNRGRWIIARCIRGDNTTHGEHDQKVCAQTLVLVVESELYGGYVPLTEGTLDKLRSMDQWTKFKSAEEMQAALNDEETKQREKIDRDMREDIEHCGKDGRVQLNRAHHLIQQHNLTVNK